MPADKMSKKIKFALTLKDGEEVRTMKELKEQLEKNFDGSIIKCFWDGENKSKLAQWLEDHYYYDEAEKINELWNEYDEQEKNSKDLDKFAYDLIEKIFSIFKLSPPDAEIVQKIDLNQIEKNSDKEDELDDKIANENVKKYLNKYINQVARNQAEFDKIVAPYLNKTNNKKVSVYILRDDDHRYIFKSQYLTETNITFVGINNDNDDEIEIEIQKNVDGKNVRWTREEYENFFNKKIIMTG